MEARVLVTTADAVLAERAARWCAAVGAAAEAVSEPTAARRHWREAAAVLVGADLAPAMASAGLHRRDHVVVAAAADHHEAWRHAVALGAIAVCDIADEAAIIEALGAALDGRGEACVVAVMGAVGGVGASSFAVDLARGATGSGARSLLVDLDPTAGGIDLLLEAEAAEGVRWNALDRSGGRVSASSLMHVLPSAHGTAFLTFSRDEPVMHPPVTGVLDAAARAVDLVVVDIPRHLGPHTEPVLSRALLTVVLVPDDLRGIAAARALTAELAALTGTVVAIGRCVRGGVGRAVLSDSLGVPVVSTRRRFGSRRRHATSRVLDLIGLA